MRSWWSFSSKSQLLIHSKADIKFVARRADKSSLWVLLIFFIGFLAGLVGYISNQGNIKPLIFSGFMLSCLLYLIYRRYDRRVKIVIDKAGIHQSKKKTIWWEDIESFHFESIITKAGNTELLWLEAHQIGQSFKIDITDLDKNIITIKNAIQELSKKFPIRFSGINSRVI